MFTCCSMTLCVAHPVTYLILEVPSQQLICERCLCGQLVDRAVSGRWVTQGTQSHFTQCSRMIQLTGRAGIKIFTYNCDNLKYQDRFLLEWQTKASIHPHKCCECPPMYPFSCVLTHTLPYYSLSMYQLCIIMYK